jgi:hypothetical protein
MEAVLEGLSHKPKPPKKVKDMRHHGIAETRIRHNHDGSHHITHEYIHPAHEPTTHGAQDLADVHDHLEEHLHGKPTPEELAEGEEE